MGYYYRFGTNIQCFQPDDDANNLWLQYDIELPYLLSQIRQHFGEDAKLEDFCIAPEYIHTDCLGYDRYDPGDYTNYLHIYRKE